MVSSVRIGAGTPSLPFDEQMEDQVNEDFFRSVSPENSPRRIGIDSMSTNGTTTSTDGQVNNGNGVEQPKSVQKLTAESLQKYKEFEKMQKLEEKKARKARRAIPPEESESGEEALSEDIYSLIYTASACSQSFYFALFVFTLQYILLVLILWDLVDLSENSGNPFRIPGGVPVRVNVAQAIAMILVVSTILVDSGDLTHGIGNLIAGYDSHVLTKNPHASFLKWFLAFFLQTLAGFSMIVVLFLLVMQSTTVISMALNFAALSFIYLIDNITFEMGKQGFLTWKIRRDCEEVTLHVVPKKRLRRQQRLRKILVVVMLIGLYIPYSFLVHNQWDSRYLCSKLYIQMSGEAIPDLVYYTGHFQVHKSEKTLFGGVRSRIDERVYYKDRTGHLVVAYCDSEMAWTISLNTTSHCAYIYKSSTTTTFDVTEVAGLTWYTWDGITRRTIASDLHLRCDDCDDGPRGNCHLHNGYCEDNECICTQNRLGVLCNDVLPACPNLHIDARTKALPTEEGVWFADNYEVLRMPGSNEVVTAQQRPVYVTYYYSPAPNEMNVFSHQDAIDVDFMLFNGRNWIILSRDVSEYYEGRNSRQQERQMQRGENSLEVLTALFDLLGTADEFTSKVLPVLFPLEEILEGLMGENYTKATLARYRPFFYSEEITPLSQGDNLQPIGLSWYGAQKPADNLLKQWRPDSRSVSSKFLCSECHGLFNPCRNSGVCNPDRRCLCSEFFSGSMCEQTVSCHEVGYCLNNGTCEAWKEYCTCPGEYFGSLCQFERLEALEYTVGV